MVFSSIKKRSLVVTREQKFNCDFSFTVLLGTFQFFQLIAGNPKEYYLQFYEVGCIVKAQVFLMVFEKRENK